MDEEEYGYSQGEKKDFNLILLKLDNMKSGL